ncbi:MAG: acetate--CoA ligase family protein [Candidatus Falkowbacteria bacterium]|nr:acetate--CoA ligase family protein [Candidatus Falkowbacteria bacterium]
MSLNLFLKPQAIALIGASREAQKIGYQILDNIIKSKFKGKIYPINLKGGKILGLKALVRLDDITFKNKAAVLVVVAIPAAFVLAEVTRAGKLGFKNLVIISAGFKESGLAGKAREDELIAVAKKYQLNILGPNCLGFINNLANLNLSFARSQPQTTGRVSGLAFLSQSGAIGSAVLDWFEEQKINFELFVSLGNKAVLSENDFLEALLTEQKVKAVFLYLEEINQGERLLNLISRLSKVKPVFVLKAGTTNLGSRAAESHTGSMAGSNQIIMTGLNRAGAIILASLEEFLDLLEFFRPLNWQAKRPADLIIVSNAGGPAVLSADEVERLHLNLAPLQPALVKHLKKVIPVLININNPLDLLGDADPKRYELALSAILSDPANTQVLVLLTAQTMTAPLKIAELIARLAKKYPRKNIFTSFIGGHAVKSANNYLAAQQVSIFSSPEAALQSWQKLFNYLKLRPELKIYRTAKISRAPKISPAPGLYDYFKSLALLKKYQIPIIKTLRYKPRLAFKLKFPLALKVVGPDFVHKSDQGAVILNLKNHAALERAYKSLRSRFKKVLINPLNYFVIQEMFKDRQEMILGFKRDASFGPILMIGQGGIYAEVFKDFKLTTADINLTQALALIDNLKVSQILRGARGQASFDIKNLAQALVNLARLARAHPEINELDINPLFVKHQGVLAIDVRIIT